MHTNCNGMHFNKHEIAWILASITLLTRALETGKTIPPSVELIITESDALPYPQVTELDALSNRIRAAAPLFAKAIRLLREREATEELIRSA